MSDDLPPPGAPAAPANLIALRDRREHVIATLSDQFAQDVLDIDEFDRRIGLAHRAMTVAELDDLVRDLAPATSTALVATPSQDALATWPAERFMRAILGGFERKGTWNVARRIKVTCFWGGGSLDFREAVFAPGVTELSVNAIMGGLEIIVPPWLAVEVEGTAVAGSFEQLERGHGEPDPGRALLRITGFVLFGGVAIETRLPGESRKQARRRMKKERKKLASAAARRALPAGRRN